MNQLETPILFIIFNRPELTKQVFEVIRQVKPTRLFVAADGPRVGIASEADKCVYTRELATAVDWPCDVQTLFREENIGCAKGPAEAITWFFNHVEQGIILEDDCLPALSFFKFCEVLLKKYDNEKKIMMIAGTNPNTVKGVKSDYFFSKYGTSWGWASWRRAWEKFDFEINNWDNDSVKIKIQNQFYTQREREAYCDIFNKTYYKQNVTWWDYQWMFARLLNDGLTIMPSKNLITNIGFGKDATHTFDEFAPEAKLKKHELKFPLKHAETVKLNDVFDRNLLVPPRISYIQKLKNRIQRFIA